MGGEQSIAHTAWLTHAGLEASAALYFQGNMINCMGMASENVWHRPLTSVSRSSNDFLPKILDGFGEHALQNSYNSVYHAPFYWGDWDMFWTGHHDALPHMVLRVISGGPVYFSDGLQATDPSRLWPLIYGDGRLIRCGGIGMPAPDWLTVDPIRTPLPFKVWNTAAGAGVLAVLHVYEEARPLQGFMRSSDIPGLAGERFIVYDYFAGRFCRAQAGEALPIAIAPLGAELYLFIPEQQFCTPIGLTDKLVSSDAVRETVSCMENGKGQLRITLKDGGRFSFVAEAPPVRAEVDGVETVVEAEAACAGLYHLDCTRKGTAEGAPAAADGVTVLLEWL